MKIRKLVSVAGSAVAMGATIAMCAMPAASASASTLGGTATIDSTTSSPLTGPQGSQTQFYVGLPFEAACDGDSTTGGYLVYSYFVPAGVSITSLNFTSTEYPSQTGNPSFGDGWNLYSASGQGYFGVQTNSGTGVIPTPQSSPFSFDPMVNPAYNDEPASYLYDYANNSSTSSVWQAGLACVKAGQITDYWGTNITFNYSSSDPDGFTWTPVAGVGNSTPEITWAAALPVAGLGVLGGVLFISRRRRTERTTSLQMGA